jgi:hypothetical protein
MYSQDRMKVRWMRGRVRRVVRVGLAADDHDEGEVLTVCADMAYLLWPAAPGFSVRLSK